MQPKDAKAMVYWALQQKIGEKVGLDSFPFVDPG